MIVVDTNVLIRFLVRDDVKQAARAASLIKGNEIWISKTVLLESDSSLFEMPRSSEVPRGGLSALGPRSQPNAEKVPGWRIPGGMRQPKRATRQVSSRVLLS